MEFDDFIVKCRKYIEHLREIFYARGNISRVRKQVSLIRRKIRDIKVNRDGVTALNTTVYLHTNDIKYFNMIADKLRDKGYQVDVDDDITFNHWRDKFYVDMRISWK